MPIGSADKRCVVRVERTKTRRSSARAGRGRHALSLSLFRAEHGEIERCDENSRRGNHVDDDNDDIPPSPRETGSPYATRAVVSHAYSSVTWTREKKVSVLFQAILSRRLESSHVHPYATIHIAAAYSTRQSMKLSNLRKIVLRFRPQDRSAREFLARVVCQRATNPDCEIDIQLHDDRPSVEVEFDTKEVVRLETEGMTAGDIVRLVSNKSKEREVMETFERAGWQKEMVVGGPEGSASWNYAGVGVRIPRR